MLELYHNGLSTCSQKVRLVLAEKGLDFTSHDVDLLGGGQHDADYVKLNPGHVVPTLVHDGHVLVESTLINEYLDDAFPDPPMRSTDPAARHAMRMWTKRLDEKVHPATGVVTFAIGPRNILLQQPDEVREANINAIPEPARRAARRSVIEHGVEAPEFAGAIRMMVDLLDRMDEALEPGAWLSGELCGLADMALLPYAQRLDHLAMGSLLEPGVRPNLADWYGRVRSRPSYQKAVADWAPEAAAAMFHKLGEEVWPKVQKVLASG